MRFKLSTIALLLLAPLAAHAQDPAGAPPPPPPPPAEPALPPPPPPPADPIPAAPVAEVAPVVPPAAAPSDGPTLKWEGLVDTYYQYNFTGDPNTQAPKFRNFDQTSNNFSLNYMKLGLQADTDMFGARVDFGYGHTGSIINGLASLPTSGAGAMDPLAGPLYGSAFFVQQAYATAKLGLLTIDAGKFVTTAGAEVIESNKNWLYSRSLLFFGIPLVHTGVRLNLKLSDMLTLQGSVVNGWNNDPDSSGDKTFGGSVLFTAPGGATTAAVTAYFGKENAAMGTESTILVDAVIGQTITEALGLNLNVDYVKSGEGYWWGGSLMGRLAVAEALYLAARGEYMQIKKGGAGGFAGSLPMGVADANLYEGTVMVGLPWGKNLEFRLEGRGDFSDKEIFAKGGAAKKNQFTGTGSVLAYF